MLMSETKCGGGGWKMLLYQLTIGGGGGGGSSIVNFGGSSGAAAGLGRLSCRSWFTATESGRRRKRITGEAAAI